ncbi:type IV pilus biogenesis/stability protein PilW [Photobacterium jeanii]|uniref:Type IV pilus biogenesis/stability protein PilW n=1 Tax=Photobacterium jeanii TaxID=858640 RepID=A0A178KAD8_9GAMM|nr:type IV pilus biogenesis/stability protein PilW [Photobacterium jeanii]OAN14291.1 type IV pilus biogenesis/stability protein PilW [Photobacterium jeanii]PST89812.1 type IV pilus biogenesis/stability protein PilW [Photobacterium jeanii]
MARFALVLAFLGWLTGCVTVDPKTTDSKQAFDSTEAAEARIALGLGYLESGQWQRARQNLEKALALTPRYYRAQNAMAFYYQKVDEGEKAEAMYKQALKDSPKNGDVRNNYGVFLCGEGRYDEAIAAFEHAIKQPYYYLTSASYENAGLCRLKQGENEDAKFYFERALAHDPQRPRSLLQLAQLHIEAKNYKDARVLLFRFNKRYGYKADSLSLLIQLETQSGRLTQAEKYADLLQEQFPDSQQNQNYLANED